MLAQILSIHEVRSMTKFIIEAMVVVTLLSGCAVTLNPDAVSPSPTNYRQTIKAYVFRTYFDPYSIRSAFISQPIYGYLSSRQGWIVCLESNAKNIMGSYIGIQRTAYLLDQDNEVYTMENAPLCDHSQITYFPWPELEQMK